MELRSFPERYPQGKLREQDLVRLLELPTDRERRPCLTCDIPCKCVKRSSECCCSCSPRCPEAPRFLSSEPDRYPIEPNTVPLVYALSALQVVPSCWSCEGHLTPAGDLIRLPQVWFYSASTLYAELISEHIDDLEFKRKLAHAWQVAVCPHTEGGTTIFAIKPDRLNEKDVHEKQLPALQQDLRTIAEHLQDTIRRMAQEMLWATRSTP